MATDLASTGLTSTGLTSTELKSKEKVLESYIVRFSIVRVSETEKRKLIRIHNLRTGETLEFESWVAAWVFLEGVLEKAV